MPTDPSLLAGAVRRRRKSECHEKRDGKLTGWFYGEVDLQHKGTRFRRRFETKAKAERLLETQMGLCASGR